jgi:hypothetical protein
VFGFEERFHDILADKPPAEFWNDVRSKKKKENKYKTCSPLKMMAPFGHQKLPKHRVY